MLVFCSKQQLRRTSAQDHQTLLVTSMLMGHGDAAAGHGSGYAHTHAYGGAGAGGSGLAISGGGTGYAARTGAAPAMPNKLLI